MRIRSLAFIPPFLITALAVVIFFVAIPLFNFSPAFFQRTLGQVSLPVDGWSVCADLGVGPVDGVPGDVQRVRMCHVSGWQVDAFCLEPAKPVPPLNTVCSMVSSTDFWCGDTVQQLREFQIVATPQADTPTPTFTATPSPTSTFTPTITQPASTLTPSATQPAPTSPAPSATPQPTPFNRPQPGGPGNLGLLVSVLSTASGLGLLALALVLRARGSSRMR